MDFLARGIRKSVAEFADLSVKRLAQRVDHSGLGQQRLASRFPALLDAGLDIVKEFLPRVRIFLPQHGFKLSPHIPRCLRDDSLASHCGPDHSYQSEGGERGEGYKQELHRMAEQRLPDLHRICSLKKEGPEWMRLKPATCFPKAEYDFVKNSC